MEQGYVERSLDPNDCGRNVVTVTPTGRRRLGQLGRRAGGEPVDLAFEDTGRVTNREQLNPEPAYVFRPRTSSSSRDRDQE